MKRKILPWILALSISACNFADTLKEKALFEDCKDGRLDMHLENTAVISSGKDAAPGFETLEKAVISDFKKVSEDIGSLGREKCRKAYKWLFPDAEYSPSLNEDIKEFMRANVLRYILRKNLPTGYSIKATFADMFTAKQGNCYIDTSLFKAFADKIGIRAKAFAIRNHVVSGHEIGDKLAYLEHTNDSGNVDREFTEYPHKMELKNKDLIARCYIGYSYNCLDDKGIEKSAGINQDVFDYLRKDQMRLFDNLIDAMEKR